MTRRLASLWFLLAAACACGAGSEHETAMQDKTMDTKQALPNWSGPPLQVKSLATRGLEVELLAPTAGHSFTLDRVELVPGGADVHFVHRGPGDAFVAQVITPWQVVVPAESLEGARRIRILIVSKELAGGREQLAFVLVR